FPHFPHPLHWSQYVINIFHRDHSPSPLLPLLFPSLPLIFLHPGMSSEEVMDDHEFLSALEQLHATEDSDVAELLKMMNENRIISWEEAEQILGDTQTVVKSSLPEQTRPSEPDNDTDIERCVQQLNDNDPNLKKVNLNNMKRTPIPSIKRLIEAVAYNTVLEELSLANLGLYDTNCEMLPAVLEINTTLKKLNLETNYLSGDFFAKLFKAACVNQTLEEVKAVNQGVSFATTAEKEIIDAIVENRGMIKISLNLRLPEGRHKIENATLRNGEIKRVLRREAAARAKKEAEEAAKKPKPETKSIRSVSKAAPLPKKPAAVPSKPVPPPPKPLPTAKPVPKPEPAKAKAVPEKPKAKSEKPKAVPEKPKAEPEKPKAVPEKPKVEPEKPKAVPKAVPAKPEPKPSPVAAKSKAASPPKEVPKPAVNKPILPMTIVDPIPLPERKTLPVTTRSTSSRTSFLKEQLEAKAKEPGKKTVRKVIRKIKKPEEKIEGNEVKEEKKTTNGKEKEKNGE
ncbi:hypothetical protein PMAYCL1PPCAC_29080, partial [Pristionchus mayeri]